MGISDILTGFVLDLEITAQDFIRDPTNGVDVDPTDLREFPLVTIVGPSSLQVGCNMYMINQASRQLNKANQLA